jgi:hypothetical protein
VEINGPSYELTHQRRHKQKQKSIGELTKPGFGFTNHFCETSLAICQSSGDEPTGTDGAAVQRGEQLLSYIREGQPKVAILRHLRVELTLRISLNPDLVWSDHHKKGMKDH